MIFDTNRPFLLAGPCVIESKDLVFSIAKTLKNITDKLGFDYIFKASFDKANRTSINSFRGPGLEEGLKILQDVKKEFEVPIVTDIHESTQAKPVAEVVDIIQIPAFLCRQTDLLVQAGNTKKIINIKKAQFLSANDMINAVKKVESIGNKKIILTERGNMFGYNNLVVDFRNIIDMKKFGYPVVIDATHSTQKPGGSGDKSGGNPQYAPYFAQCATICGAQGYFFETHPNPQCALSDASSMIQLDKMEKILKDIKTLYDISKQLQ